MNPNINNYVFIKSKILILLNNRRILYMKIKLNIRLFAILLIIAVLGFKIQLSFAAQTFDNRNQKLKFFLANIVENDPEINSCVLSVMKGDSSYYWSGASGIASQNGQVPMTKDTPVYIASVTKDVWK